MSRLGSDADFLRLAAEQAAAFLPKKRKPKGRKKYGVAKLVYGDPRFWAKANLGSLHDSAAAKDLWMVFAKPILQGTNDEGILKLRPKANQRLQKRFNEAVKKKDFIGIRKIADAVEMFLQNPYLFRYPRHFALARVHQWLFRRTGKKPTAAEIIVVARKEFPALFGKVLDEAIFRDIREMRIPISLKKANKRQKKR
jgi:hypothetical protein